MQIHLKFDPETATFDQMIALQEAAGSTLREQRALMSAFVVGADGKPLPQAEAEALLGQLSIVKMREAIAAFNAQVNTAMQDTLPNEPGQP